MAKIPKERLPKRRGIYSLAYQYDTLYIYVQHRPPFAKGNRRCGRVLSKYMAMLNLDVERHLSDRNLMRVVELIRNEIDAQQAQDPSIPATPLIQLIEEYADYLDAHGRTAADVYTRRLRMLAALGHGKRPRTALLAWQTPRDISRKSFVAYMVARSEESSQSEANHELATWRAFVSYLVDLEVLQANPLLRMKSFTQAGQHDRALDVAEVDKFLDACRDDDAPTWLYPVALIVAWTGLRPAEVGRLTWDGVDLSGRRFYVRRKGQHIWAVPMGEQLATVLDRVDKRARVGRVVPGFPYEEGRLAQYYHRAVRDAAKRAGLVGVTLKTLRHTVATTLANAGWSAPQLQAAMGWTSSAMAQRYVHLAALDVADLPTSLPWARPPEPPPRQKTKQNRNAKRDQS